MATVSSTGEVSIIGADSATITATKAGDNNYDAASGSYSLTVSKATQTGFSAGSNVSKTFGETAFT